MKLEEQLIAIAVREGLASLSIDVHFVSTMQPWIAVSAQAVVDPGKRVQGGAKVGDGGIIAAIHEAIADLRIKITDYNGIAALEPLADSEGDEA